MNNSLKIAHNLKNDLPASIVVFLVAVPLCLGIALASGAPLFSGIIAGIVGGIVVGSLSGSALGVSGPAAGLTVIVLSAIMTLGSFEAFLLATVLAGLIQLVLGFAKAGIIGYYFPSSVIKGMLTGIGIIIILKQIPHAVGYDADYEGDLAFSQPDGQNTFTELANMVNFISPGAVIITVISLAILILWEQPFIKKLAFTKIIQGQLVAVLAGIGLNIYFRSNPSFQLTEQQIVNIPVAESLTGFFSQFTLPDFGAIANPQVWVVAITIAVVASLETLLSVEAIDKLDPYKRVTPTNRELKAQGMGNMISGLIGGLPVTQVIVRSSVNMQSGGVTKMSAVAHGVLMFICVLAIPNLLNLIPLASLAAVLFVVGYKLAKPALFKQMYQKGWIQFIPFMVTILGIIFTDLLVGIGLGMAVAIFQILYENYKTPYHFDPEKHHDGETITIELSENVSFINKASIMRTLKKVPENSKVVINGKRSVIIDPDVREIIDDFRESAKHKNIELEVIGMEDSKRNSIKQFDSSVISSAPRRVYTDETKNEVKIEN